MNPIYTTAAASPIICRRITATATTVSSSTTSSVLSSSTARIGRINSGVSTVRHAAHVSKVALKAQELHAAKAAAAAVASSTAGSSSNGAGLPGSADRMMAAQLAARGELSPAEKQKMELRLMKMKMSRKQFMKWLKAHPQNPITIPNVKAVLPEGHGENIWLWNHIEAGHVVYSMHPEMDSNKSLAQFPYTGKKLVPPKLRRDYWRPFAQIRFPSKQGEIGRSVWQKLVELKKRHELEWGDQKHDFLHMSREERGAALNDQRANVIADIAAVLGGLGKGNKIWLSPPTKKDEGKLCEATVYWANGQDRHYAAEWPENVKHFLGLPGRNGKAESVDMDAVAPEPEVEVVEEGKEQEKKDDDDDEGKGPGGGDGGPRETKKVEQRESGLGSSVFSPAAGMIPIPIPVGRSGR